MAKSVWNYFGAPLCGRHDGKKVVMKLVCVTEPCFSSEQGLFLVPHWLLFQCVDCGDCAYRSFTSVEEEVKDKIRQRQKEQDAVSFIERA